MCMPVSMPSFYNLSLRNTQYLYRFCGSYAILLPQRWRIHSSILPCWKSSYCIKARNSLKPEPVLLIQLKEREFTPCWVSDRNYTRWGCHTKDFLYQIRRSQEINSKALTPKQRWVASFHLGLGWMFRMGSLVTLCHNGHKGMHVS